MVIREKLYNHLSRVYLLSPVYRECTTVGSGYLAESSKKKEGGGSIWNLNDLS